MLSALYNNTDRRLWLLVNHWSVSHGHSRAGAINLGFMGGVHEPDAKMNFSPILTCTGIDCPVPCPAQVRRWLWYNSGHNPNLELDWYN